MAFENLIVRKSKDIKGITIDGIIREKFRKRIRPTTNPIELGVQISDHAVIEPVSYSIEGVITDTPLGREALTTAFSTVQNVLGDSTGEGITRSTAAYLELEKLANKVELITLQTSLKLLENMLITSLDVDKTKTTARAVFFTMELQELIVVSTRTVARSEDQTEGDVRMSATTRSELGRKNPVAIEQENKSLIARALDVIF